MIDVFFACSSFVVRICQVIYFVPNKYYYYRCWRPVESYWNEAKYFCKRPRRALRLMIKQEKKRLLMKCRVSAPFLCTCSLCLEFIWAWTRLIKFYKIPVFQPLLRHNVPAAARSDATGYSEAWLLHRGVEPDRVDYPGILSESDAGRDRSTWRY